MLDNDQTSKGKIHVKETLCRHFNYHSPMASHA